MKNEKAGLAVQGGRINPITKFLQLHTWGLQRQRLNLLLNVFKMYLLTPLILLTTYLMHLSHKHSRGSGIIPFHRSNQLICSLIGPCIVQTDYSPYGGRYPANEG